MSRFYSYLNSAVKILSEYDGKTPFSLFLKQFFSKNKKYGSRDRRLISDYCYQYFRLSRAFTNKTMEERLLIGRFLCSTSANHMLEVHRPEWNEAAGLAKEAKFKMLGVDGETLWDQQFPWKDELSNGIDFKAFAESHFLKPDVFLRIRPGKKDTVKLKLKGHHIQFKEIAENSLSVESNSKLDEVLGIDKEVVVQDFSSQRVGTFLSDVFLEENVRVWDCCAASGGKSIMAYDMNPTIQLTVSDVRESILHNLKNRFETAGIANYDSFQVDLSQPQSILNTPFDVIIADVPCTGSGTWGRTPEQLYYFEEPKIEEYASLQKKIVSNALPHLKKVDIWPILLVLSLKRRTKRTWST
ncbi:MAG: Fmu (Sun) domain-containing protein [Balneola sp.]